MAKKGYTQIIRNTSLVSPSDTSVNYFWNGTVTSTANQARVYPLIAGTITEVTVNIAVTGTLGSIGTPVSLYLNKNGAVSETLITDSLELIATQQGVTLRGLNIAVNGTTDYFNIQMTCPTRATNPTNVNLSAFILIQ